MKSEQKEASVPWDAARLHALSVHRRSMESMARSLYNWPAR